MRLTEEDIESGKTAKGGFTRKQLAAWGVAWPPPRGWKDALLRGSSVPLKKAKKAPRRDNSKEARDARRKLWLMDQEYSRVVG